MIMKYKQAINYIFHFLIIMFVLRYWFYQKTEITFIYLLLLFLIRIKFGHFQISVPKISTPISKTA